MELRSTESDERVNVFHGLEGQVPPELAEELTRMQLVDHHVHGTYSQPISRARFEESMNEGSTQAIPPFMSMFDSQLGFAVRRWAAPQLGLPTHASAEDYWSRRHSMSPDALDTALLPPARIGHWLVDTGFHSTDISSPEDLAAASGSRSGEIVRLEQLAETIADAGTAPADFTDAFRHALTEAAKYAVGFKTIVAYRIGFDIDWSAPSDEAVAAAVGGWLKRSEGEPLRLTDPTVIGFLIHSAVELGLPIQFHVGFGDRDLDLHRCNPMLLLPLLRQPQIANTPITLLHCWPYHREAGYLAQAFDNVYFDVGLTLNYVGAQSTQIVRETLEVAPFAKQLFSSDAFGLPEMHLLGSVLWRRSIGLVLGEWVRQGDWSLTDAIRVGRMIGHENAARVYHLTE